MKRMELIKSNFKRLRKERGWTQEQLADIGNVSKGYIGQIEAGLAESFGAEAEEKWAGIFKVPIAELFKDLHHSAIYPIEFEQEIMLFKQEAAKYGGTAIVRSLRKSLPTLYEGKAAIVDEEPERSSNTVSEEKEKRTEKEKRRIA